MPRFRFENFTTGNGLPDNHVYAVLVDGEILLVFIGFVKEEAYEHGKSPESQKKAQEGRDLRNEGRVEDV